MQARGLNIPYWEQVKADLQRALKDQGPDHFPIATFSLWRLVKDALLRNNVKVREQREEINKTFGETQDQESEKSTRDQEEQDSQEPPTSLPDEEDSLEAETEQLKKRVAAEDERVPPLLNIILLRRIHS